MSYMVKQQGVGVNTQVVAVGGELDMHAAPDLQATIDQVIADGASRLVVDLTEATFIDSAGIGVLVATVRRLEAAGGSLELVCSQPNLLRVFEIVGLDRVLSIHSSRDVALEAVTGAR